MGTLDAKGIRERVKAAVAELEAAVAAIPPELVRERPIEKHWTAAEVVDHIAQTQIRAVEELRHLLAGRRPPGPPVYEALRSGAPAWVPWEDLVDGMVSANRELVHLLESPPESEEAAAARARTVLVVSRALAGGGTKAQIFMEDVDWRGYAILQRLHLLDHRTQLKNLHRALLDQRGGAGT